MPSIRPLTPADAERYVLLRREMLLDSPKAFSASPGQDRGSDPEGLRTSLAGSEYAIIGAFEGPTDQPRLVAVAGLIREAALKRRHIAKIWGVYVSPAARGRGLGRAVVSATIQIARSWPGIAQVQLSAGENSTAAISLYRSLGFTVWGVEPDCLRIEGVGYAEHHMSLSLD